MDTLYRRINKKQTFQRSRASVVYVFTDEEPREKKWKVVANAAATAAPIRFNGSKYFAEFYERAQINFNRLRFIMAAAAFTCLNWILWAKKQTNNLIARMSMNLVCIFDQVHLISAKTLVSEAHTRKMLADETRFRCANEW